MPDDKNWTWVLERRCPDCGFFAGEFEAIGVVERRTGLHTQQSLVCVRIMSMRVVQVIGGEKWQVELFRQTDEVSDVAALNLDAVVHDFDEEVLFAEDVSELGCGLKCLIVLPEAQTCLNLATDTARGCDNPLGKALQQFAVHTRLEVVALNARE